MSDTYGQQLRVAAARADFLEYGPEGAAGVDDMVVASWRRSLSAGVDVDHHRATYHADIDFDSRLARCARPVIERLTDDMTDIPVTIALTDSAARIIDRRDGSPAVGRILDRVEFARGYSYAEGGVGTNGVGTVFEVGAPVTVIGSEHFTQSLVQFACTGAPVIDPLTRRVAGVLDVSTLAESWNPLVTALVRSAAADISRNLLYDRSQAKRAVFESFLRADNRFRHAVVAVGKSGPTPGAGGTVMLNDRARALLGDDAQQKVTQFAEYLAEKCDSSAHSMPLADGRRIRLRAHPDDIGPAGDGVVAVFDDERSALPASPDSPRTSQRPRTPDRPAGDERGPVAERTPGTSAGNAGWAAAAEEFTRAVHAHEGVLILGESGSGRTTLAADTFRGVYELGEVIVLDAVHLDDVGAPGTPESAGLLVLRHVDKVGPDALGTLTSVIDRARGAGYQVAVTAEPVREGPAVHAALLGHLNRTVLVPPLRLRGDELPGLAGNLLKQLSPQGKSRIGPDALEVIRGYAWPGNIPRLRQALIHALRSRPVGEIQAGDLPGFCRTTSTRRLTTLEIGERDSIIAALAEHDGNRVRAAAALGISRSSLYRKIGAYGLSGV
jgi:transcriptional regulator of acetoin/glycerol metabolism